MFGYSYDDEFEVNPLTTPVRNRRNRTQGRGNRTNRRIHAIRVSQRGW